MFKDSRFWGGFGAAAIILSAHTFGYLLQNELGPLYWVAFPAMALAFVFIVSVLLYPLLAALGRVRDRLTRLFR